MTTTTEPRRTRAPAAVAEYAERLAGAKSGNAPDTSLVPADAASLAIERLAPSGLATIDKVKMDLEMAEALAAELAAGGYEMSPVFVKIEPGDMIRGRLVAKGSVEIEDKRTKEPKAVNTWTLEDERGYRAQFLSCYQLDRELQAREVNPVTGEIVETPHIGRYVILCRLPDERISNGNMVGRWRVAVSRAQPEGAASGVDKAGAK